MQSLKQATAANKLTVFAIFKNNSCAWSLYLQQAKSAICEQFNS